ncbi:Leucine-rich repeat protein soc-2-like protein, partial [Diplonema papillatum]
GDTEIVLNCFKFDTIPDVLFQCSHLQSLTSSMNGMRTVPEAFGERLQNLTTLNLSQNHIVSVPASLGLLRKLTRLDLNRNDITSVPDALANLKQLKVANFDYNELDAIPSCLCRIANLEQCYVAQNEGIATIPLEAKNWKMCQ